MRIGFFGTPELASRVLIDMLAESQIEVVFVVTNPDKPFGRNQELKASPVKETAIAHDIPIFQPEKIRGNQEFFDVLKNYACDYFVVVAYGRILPNEILNMPKNMCINVHGSILPKYRWASPIQSALLHGEKETGVTIMKMSEGMDEWDILSIKEIAIAPEETSGSLFEKFAQVSGKALVSTIIELEWGKLYPIPQNHMDATYCSKIEKENGLVDWSKSAESIYHQWQAYTPWPGVYTYYDGKRLLLEKVGMMEYETWKDVPGTVIKIASWWVWVVCSEWILTLEQVKLEWKKSQNIKDFVNGNQKFIWITL